MIATKTGRYSSPKQRRWTRTAVECYFIGCNCQKCYLNEIMQNECRMKGAVLELVRTLGKPEKEYELND